MRQIMFLVAVCVLTLAISKAEADTVWDLDPTAVVTADGDFLPGNSYFQAFTASLSGMAFNKVKVQIASADNALDTFEQQPINLNPAFTLLSPAGWSQVSDDGLTAVATGSPAVTSVSFTLNWNDRSPVVAYSATNPLVFDLFMLRVSGATEIMQGAFEETYVGGLHGWSSVPIVPLPAAAWMGLSLMGAMGIWQVCRKVSAAA